MKPRCDKPWLGIYGDRLPEVVTSRFNNALEMFTAALSRSPNAPLIHYFHSTLTVSQVDELSNALALAMQDAGVTKGDRVAVYLQNVPQYVLTLLAAWKLGAILVSVNPMYKKSELTHLLKDSRACLLVTLQSLYWEVARQVIPDTDVRAIITTSELDFLNGTEVPCLLQGADRRMAPDTIDLCKCISQYAGRCPEPVQLSQQDIALLTYTSGTTGPAKGAMVSHGNVVFNAEALRIWADLGQSDVILGMAPLFHATGLIVHIVLSLVAPTPLVLFYRFDAETVAQMIEHYHATYTAGAITAFNALLNTPVVKDYRLSTLQKIHSGGAPIPASIVNEFKDRFNLTIYPAYGMTEATATVTLGPFGVTVPADPKTGSLSVGIPISNVKVQIIDEEGNNLPSGEVGEIVIRSPGVIEGYWQKPMDTEKMFLNRQLKTGDVGYMDQDGWLYIVDRIKDLIIASGYKVWPREVEDVLYQHVAIREAAVIGAPDQYRGETVVAFVSVKPNAKTTEAELIDHCGQHLAAYKRPSKITILDDLPKSASGKVLRRVLRQE